MAATRDVLIEAALACDFDRLAALAETEIPSNTGMSPTFWGEPSLTADLLRRLDETQNALWDLAVALIYTPTLREWDFTGSGPHMYWFPWPEGRLLSNPTSASESVADQLERMALLDGTTPAEFADRVLAGYSTFRVVIGMYGEWWGASPPTPGRCLTEPGSAIDLTDEPDWRRLFSWTDALGCPVRVDVLYERTGPDHCDWQDTRVLATGNPLGTRYHDSTDDVEYVRDPSGQYHLPALVAGFVRLDSLPTDAVDTGFRLRDRELWTSPSDPDAIYINSANGVERWPRGEPPPCL